MLAAEGRSMTPDDYRELGFHMRQLPIPWRESFGGSRAERLATRRLADVYHAGA